MSSAIQWNEWKANWLLAMAGIKPDFLNIGTKPNAFQARFDYDPEMCEADDIVTRTDFEAIEGIKVLSFIIADAQIRVRFELEE